MNVLLRRLFSIVSIVVLSVLRLSAAESRPVRVPVRWAGGPPAAAVRIEALDSSHRATGAIDASVVDSSLEVPDSFQGESYRFSADGFVPASLGRDRLAFGVLLRAYGSVIVEIPVESRPSASVPSVVTVHVVEDRPDPRGITRIVAALRRGEYSFPAPPGTWHLLVDDGAEVPRVVEGVRVGSGQTQRVRLPAPGPASTETYSVTGPGGKPLAGAEFRWGEDRSPADALLARWTASRQLRTSREGRLRIDRLPASAHSWTIRAEGFRTRTFYFRPREAGLALRDESIRRVALRPLPTLRIHLKGRIDPSRSAILSLWRIAPGADAAGQTSTDRPVWKGPIVAEAAMPGLTGGLYRAEVAMPGMVAVAEKTVDASDEADDFQDLTVEVIPKIVKGRVTRSDGPVADAAVEALPADSGVTPATTRLARTKTGADGSFSLSFSYRGIVSITASTEAASKTRNVDLVGADEADADFEFRPARVILQVSDRKTGAPVAAAELATEFVPSGRFSEGIRVGTADATGRLRLEDLSDGLLKVTARAKGYATRIMRDVPVAPEGESEVPVELTRTAPFRIRVVDEFATPVPKAEVLVERDPHVRRPRQCPLRSLGRTDEGGELVLEELTGEQTPAYVVGAGLTAQAFWLPGHPDPEGGLDGNTAEVVMAHHAAAPGIRVLGASGALREDAVLVFERNGIEVPFSVISLAADANGLGHGALFQRGDRAIHYHELLAPGRYSVEALSPRPGAPGDPTQDVKDVLGIVTLPPAVPIDLAWKEDRAYPPSIPQ